MNSTLHPISSFATFAPLRETLSCHPALVVAALLV